MEKNNIRVGFPTISDSKEKSELIIEEKTGKSWNEWERILETTDITTASQQEYISDLKTSFNIDGLTAAMIVIHYKSKHHLFQNLKTQNSASNEQADSQQ